MRSFADWLTCYAVLYGSPSDDLARRLHELWDDDHTVRSAHDEIRND